MKPDELIQEIFMRFIVLSILLIISNFTFSQDSATIKEINALIGPKFYFDTINYKISAVEMNGNFLVVAMDSNYSDSYRTKIFILKRLQSKFLIIDSSTTFLDLSGNISQSNDTIEIFRHYSGGGYTFDYKFDRTKQKYSLINMEDAYPKGGIDCDYNVRHKQLTISKRNVHDKWRISKTIKKSLPKNFIPDLAHFIDPLGEDVSSNIYEKIFVTYN